jgi:hypothetical protein
MHALDAFQAEQDVTGWVRSGAVSRQGITWG